MYALFGASSAPTAAPAATLFRKEGIKRTHGFLRCDSSFTFRNDEVFAGGSTDSQLNCQIEINALSGT